MTDTSHSGGAMGNDEGEDGEWATGQQIAASLPSLDGVDPDHPVVTCGLLVDVVARVGVLAMPSETSVGLNLEGAPTMTRRVEGDEDLLIEYSSSAASILRGYLTAHPEIARGVCGSAHKAPDGEFRCGKFIRGVSAEAAAAAMAWRKSELPAELVELDSAAAPPKANPWNKAKSAHRGAEQTERDASKRDKKQKKEKKEPEKKVPVVLIPAEAPAVPAWGGAASAKPPASASMSQILEEQSTRPVVRQPQKLDAASGTPGIIRLPKGGVAPKNKSGGGGGWADRLRGRPSGGGGTTAWDMQSQDVGSLGMIQRPAPPKIPKITPEGLTAEARKSKVDQFGKVRCLVCNRAFLAHKPLEQHLAASHFGLNSMEAKALEAKLVAAGVHIPGDGSEKTKPDRMAVQFGEILDQPRSRPGDASIANLAHSLAAYIRETPKKKEKRAAAIGATGRMKHGGQMVVNPNQASSSGLVHRRGKERADGRKKKGMTKLKKIILSDRAVRLEREETAKKELETNAKETGEKEAEEEKGVMELEVTVEVGRVYVNLLVPEGDEGVVGVDLVYLEDDEDDDEDDEYEAVDEAVAEPEPEAVPEPEPEAVPELKADPAPELKAESVPELKADPAPEPVSEPEPEANKPGGVWAALNPVNWFKQPEETKKKDAGNKKDRPKQATVVCDVCGKSVSGDGAWQMHIEGAYHKKALLRKEREAAGEVVQPPNPPGTGKRAQKKLKASPPGVEGSTNDTSKKNMNTFMGTDVKIRYAEQVVTPEVNKSVVECIGELKRFQDRLYFKDPIKAKMRRRLVFGLREVHKYVSLQRAKALVIAPNIEETEQEGGLDDVLGKIIEEAKANGTPLIFALTRGRLGQIVGKRMRISALAVLDESGAEQQFKAMLDDAKEGRKLFANKKRLEEEAAAKAKLNPTAAVFVPRSITN